MASGAPNRLEHAAARIPHARRLRPLLTSRHARPVAGCWQLLATPAERLLVAIHVAPEDVPPQLADEWRQAKRFADVERFVQACLALPHALPSLVVAARC